MTTAPHNSDPIEWHRIGNVPLARVSLAQTLDLIAHWKDQSPFRIVVTPNVDHIVILQHHAPFRRAYAASALSLADGAPVVWATRYLGLPLFEKVSGSDLAPALCLRGAREGWRVFFIGGHTPEDLVQTLDLIRPRHPGLVVDGYCPPFGFETSAAEGDKILARIASFAPQLVLMACGSPKSEVWLTANADRIGLGIGISIGAGLRFLAGTERRAPRWMQRAGLEWFWRLAGNPRRMWKRYLVDDMRFFPLVFRWKRRSDFGPWTRNPQDPAIIDAEGPHHAAD